VLREEPAWGERTVLAHDSTSGFGRLEAVRLSHGIDSYGYRLTEPDGRRMLPDRLAKLGVSGPRISELQQRGRIAVGGREVALEEVSAPRRGQAFAFIMDTRLCDGVYELADRADMLVIESTFLDQDAALATEFGHLTARQAASVAAECGVRTLVLTHFSQRYTDPTAFEREAREVFTGELHVAEDLMRVRVPKRAV
jgi:ribonuclease Z